MTRSQLTGAPVPVGEVDGLSAVHVHLGVNNRDNFGRLEGSASFRIQGLESLLRTVSGMLQGRRG